MDAENDYSSIVNRWSHGGSATNRDFTLYSENRYIKFAYHTIATNTWAEPGFDTLPSYEQISLDTWHHIVVTRNDEDLRIYVDGVLQANRDIGTELLIDTASLPLRIGGENGSAFNKFDGLIDEVAKYKKSMEERQVQYLYQQGVAGSALPTDTVVTVAHPSTTVTVTPAKITIGDCQGYDKMIALDSSASAPAPATLTTDCSENIGAHDSSALPATSDTVDVYLGNGVDTVHGTNYPVFIDY